MSGAERLPSPKPANDQGEEWRPVRAFPGYEVSNLGRVRSLKRGRVRVLDRHEHYLGYLRVLLSRDGQHHVYVHRLVADAFLGPCPPKHEVDHVDGNKGNCAAWNLEYVTRSENILRAFRLGLCKPLRGERSPSAKITAADAIAIFARMGQSAAAVASDFQVGASAVEAVWSGRSWGHVTGKRYKPRRSIHGCGTCGQRGHNARTCPTRPAREVAA